MTNLAYKVEREFPVSIERLWECWTEAAELANWYCPPNMRVKPGSTVSDPSQDGLWQTAVEIPGDGGTAYFWGRYGKVEAPAYAEHSLFYSVDEADFIEASELGESHLVVLEFETRDDGAWVRYSQFGEMPPEMAEGARQGMETYLDHLESFLSRP